MQYAVVTGATQGIGKAITEKLLKEGLSIAVCGRDAGKLADLEAEWSKAFPGSLVIYFKADLSKKEEVVAFTNHVSFNFPNIDLLVNNAGTFLPGNLADEADGHLEELMATNLYSAYYISRALLPKMKERKGGHIFNMCSVASLKAYPNGGSYSISKYALLGFSDNLRLELMPDNIKVTSLCPGATYTPSWAGSGVDPLRIMEANDIANVLWAAYTLSAQANVETIVLRPVKGDL